MQLLENIHGTQLSSQIFEWLQSLKFDKLVKSSYAGDRLEMRVGLGSNLQSIPNKRGQITKHSEPPSFIAEIGNKHMPTWNSILVCKGHLPESNTSIAWHRDHGHFHGPAVMINFGKSDYSQKHYELGIQGLQLNNGDIISIDTKLLH